MDRSKLINKYAKILTSYSQLKRSDVVDELRTMFIEAGNFSIAAARKVMREAFKKDPDWKRTYIDNISMRIFYNQMGIDDKELRDKLSEQILDLVFEE